MTSPGKTYTGEGSASSEKLEKPVWRPKGRQLNKFRSMQITKINGMLRHSLATLLICLSFLSLGGLMPACGPEGLPEGLQ